MTKLFTKEIEVKTYTVEYTIFSKTNHTYLQKAQQFDTYRDAKNFYDSIYDCSEVIGVCISTNWETKRVKRFGK